jgi:hypothetical protein
VLVFHILGMIINHLVAAVYAGRSLPVLIFRTLAMMINHLVYHYKYEGTYEVGTDTHTRPTRRQSPAWRGRRPRA